MERWVVETLQSKSKTATAMNVLQAVLIDMEVLEVEDEAQVNSIRSALATVTRVGQNATQD